MAQVINTNIASLNAQRNLNNSQAAGNQALERLSSGLRINSAKDDAAGLAISTRFQSQINGLNVAARNAGDGVSLSQTAEGALGSMTDSLQRIRELALQAANGTNSAQDRQALNSEAQQLIEEVTRAGEQTNFNGLNLLDGSFASTFQVGANAGETIDVSIGKLTADTLGVSTANGVSATATGNALGVGDLVINGVTVGASRASDDTASTDLQSASAIAKAEAINRVADESGVRAIVDENIAAGTSMTASTASGTVTLNGVDIDIVTTNDAASSRSAVVTAINAVSDQTGVTAVDTGDDKLGVTLVAADGRNIELDLTDANLTSVNTGLADGNVASEPVVYTGGYTLVAQSGTNEINISGSDVTNAGLTAGAYTAGVSSVATTGQVFDGDNADINILEAGDLVINGVNIGAATAVDDAASYTSGATESSSSKLASGISIAAAINRSTDSTGVTATVNATEVVGDAADDSGSAGLTGTLFLNGEEISLTHQGGPDENRTHAVNQINAVSGQTGVVAEDNGSSITLTAADGRNIVMAFDEQTGEATAAQFGLAGDNIATGAYGTAAAFDENAITTYSSVSLSSGGQMEISGGNNGNAALEALGFKAGTFGGGEIGQFLNEVDISTQAGANSALAAIDNALDSVNSARADLGAIQNRFETTIGNLQLNSENLSAANSRIQDADFASETAALSRSQVLQQAGTSILAQANAAPQQVLALLP